MKDHTAFILELLNGGSIIPECFWLILLGLYLSRESRRRGLHSLDWLRLPPSMNLIVAVFICDLGVFVRSVTAWAWRRFFDAGDFGFFQSALLVAGGGLIAIGFLCKFRAMTEPDLGDGPWLIAVAATGAALIGLMFFR